MKAVKDEISLLAWGVKMKPIYWIGSKNWTIELTIFTIYQNDLYVLKVFCCVLYYYLVVKSVEITSI